MTILTQLRTLKVREYHVTDGRPLTGVLVNYQQDNSEPHVTTLAIFKLLNGDHVSVLMAISAHDIFGVKGIALGDTVSVSSTFCEFRRLPIHVVERI